jgi:hypothetical protein
MRLPRRPAQRVTPLSDIFELIPRSKPREGSSEESLIRSFLNCLFSMPSGDLAYGYLPCDFSSHG